LGQRTSGTFLQFISDALEFFFLVEIGGNVVGFAFAKGVQLFTCLFAGLRVARGYVYCSAVLDESFADHASNAFGTACHEYYFVLAMVSFLDAKYITSGRLYSECTPLG
jgi:hypothetical protein